MGQAKIRQAEINQLKAAESARSINSEILTRLLLRLSQVIAADHADHGYNQTADSRAAAVQTIEYYKLERADYAQLLEFREAYNDSINKSYGVELATGAAAFLQDPDAVLRATGMPQIIQISVGLLDTLIAVLAMRVGAIKFYNL